MVAHPNSRWWLTITSDSDDEQELRIPILSKLFRRDLWGKSYTTIENCLSKIPSHRRGDAKDEIDSMNKEGLVIYHKRKTCVSLNPSAKERIEEMLRGHLPDFFF